MRSTVTLEASVDDILAQIDVADIREYLGEPKTKHTKTADMSDPVARLDAIVQLRRLGYTVESGEGA